MHTFFYCFDPFQLISDSWITNRNTPFLIACFENKAITTNIRRLVATYDFLQGQHHEFHQRALISKNKAVQCHLRDNANRLVRIVDKIGLETVRHNHLTKMLASYTRS